MNKQLVKSSKNKEWEVPEYEVYELKPKSGKYCVCIPVINEGEKIKKQLERMKDISKQVDVIIADGGSTDGSLETELLKKMNVRSLLVKKGKGKLSAQLRMAYAYALEQGYKGIITIDGNGKDDPAEIIDFTKALDEGYDLIQGSRFVKGGKAINTPISRWLAIKLIHAPLISLISGFRYTDTTNGFRGYSEKFLLHDKVKPFRKIFDTYELLAYLSVKAPQLKLKVKEMPVTRAYPKGKVPTKISPIKGNLLLLKILSDLALKKYDVK